MQALVKTRLLVIALGVAALAPHLAVAASTPTADPSDSSLTVDDDGASDVIRDYPVEINSLTVETVSLPYPPRLPEGAVPVALKLDAYVPALGHSISMEAEGISVPATDIEGVAYYMPFFRLGHTIFAAKTLYLDQPGVRASIIEVATIDAYGQVQENDTWALDFLYREYRYTLKDRLAALAFGIWVKNSETLMLSARKK